jgi:hypothetical protein
MPYGNPTRPPSPVRSGEQSQSSPKQPSALWVGVVARFGRRSHLNGPRYKFWQTMAIAASMLLFAALRPPTTEVTAGDTTQLTRRDPSSNELRGSTSGTPSQQAEVLAAEARPRKSDHVVARDLHTHNIATMQKSELTRSTQRGVVIQKRVVLD